MALVLTYPHFIPSYEPKPISAEAIWRVAEAARDQICPYPHRPRLEIGSIIACSRHLEINGIAFQTHWECGQPVHDEAGHPVLGATEHDVSWPEAAMIYINAAEIGARDDLARSTAVHELGHAVFDTPSWIQRSRQRTLPFSREFVPLERRFHAESGARSEGAGGGERGIDWREWRANEFMGGFLTPRRLLHRFLHRKAAAFGVPMFSTGRETDLPVVHARRTDHHMLLTLVIELADEFGVSDAFMRVRLTKYGLVRGQ